MRMSCNGCRVLRKGCSESCSIKPCLHWIKSPTAQANATLFLAKFYGRTGLLNLLNAAPHPLRPGVFRSLLYEACGRTVNPIHGATGLLWSGNWHLCQAAVEAVLSDSPISKVSADSAACAMSPPPLKAGNIRHVSKDENSPPSAAKHLHKVKTKGKFKRAGVEPKVRVDDAARVIWSWSHKEEVVGSPSRGSGVSEHGEPPSRGDRDSVGTLEASMVKPGEPADGNDVELELTLGFEPVLSRQQKMGAVGLDERINGSDDNSCTMSSHSRDLSLISRAEISFADS